MPAFRRFTKSCRMTSWNFRDVESEMLPQIADNTEISHLLRRPVSCWHAVLFDHFVSCHLQTSYCSARTHVVHRCGLLLQVCVCCECPCSLGSQPWAYTKRMNWWRCRLWSGRRSAHKKPRRPTRRGPYDPHAKRHFSRSNMGMPRFAGGHFRVANLVRKGAGGIRRILVRGSMPPCRLRRRKFWKSDYEIVHSEVQCIGLSE